MLIASANEYPAERKFPHRPTEGESPVAVLQCVYIRNTFLESRFLGVKRKVGGKLHLRLNRTWETDSK